MPDETRVNSRRARSVLVVIALVGASIGALIGLVVGAPVVGALVGLAGGAAAAVWLERTSTDRVLRRLDARPLAAGEEPRLQNLVEGLSLTSGVPTPALHVVDDPYHDVAVLGRTPRDAALVFTSALLGSLERIELEGVVAHLLVRIRNDEIAPATLAAGLGPLSGPVVDRLLAPDRITRADLEACQLTRYPPGLIGALEKVAAARPTMTHARVPVPAHLCFAPAGSDRAHSSHPPLDERIALLREL